MENAELESKVREFVSQYLKEEIEKQDKKYPEDKKKYPKNPASLTCGILSIVFACMWYISIPCGILGIVFGRLGIKNTGSKAAKAGLICGIVGLSICVVIYMTIVLFYIASRW
jgi:uncharacterized membrane protein